MSLYPSFSLLDLSSRRKSWQIYKIIVDGKNNCKIKQKRKQNNAKKTRKRTLNSPEYIRYSSSYSKRRYLISSRMIKYENDITEIRRWAKVKTKSRNKKKIRQKNEKEKKKERKIEKWREKLQAHQHNYIVAWSLYLSFYGKEREEKRLWTKQILICSRTTKHKKNKMWTLLKIFFKNILNELRIIEERKKKRKR